MHNRADEIGTDGVNQNPSDVENWDLIRTQLIELSDLDEIIIKYSLIYFYFLCTQCGTRYMNVCVHTHVLYTHDMYAYTPGTRIYILLSAPFCANAMHSHG